MATSSSTHQPIDVFESENYTLLLDRTAAAAASTKPTTPVPPLAIQPTAAPASPLPAWARSGGYNRVAAERRLHEEIIDFTNWITPWTDEQRMRDWVAEKVTLIIQELWPKANVRIYGSFHTNLYLPSSDIDIVVLGAPSESNNQVALLQLADRLHARGETTMHVIPTAKVPIIKLIERETNMMVDISFNVNSGPENTEIVQKFLREHAELRPLVLVLKYFLAQNRLNEPYWGGMGSYALVLLATFIIKRHKASLPPDATANLGELLLEFFRFFGKELKTESEAVSVKNTSVFTKESRGWFDPANPLSYSVEDPQNTENDVGRGMFSAAAVRRAFSGAHDTLTALGMSLPLLSSIIVPDKLYEDFRLQTAGRFTANYDALVKQLELQRAAVQARANSPNHEQPRQRKNGGSNRQNGRSTYTNTQHGGMRSRRQSESPRAAGATARAPSAPVAPADSAVSQQVTTP